MNNIKSRHTAWLGFITFILTLATACTHKSTWIHKKTKGGAVIGYYQSKFTDTPKDIIRSFKKTAKEACGKKKWRIVKEIIPAPTSAVSAIRNASKGDLNGAASSSAGTLIHDGIHRSGRMSKNVKVVYGSPLDSFNKAEIRCR